MAHENLKSIDFPEGTRVKIVATEFDSPIGKHSAKGSDEGVGRTARVHRVFFTDDVSSPESEWRKQPKTEQCVMYTLTDEESGELIQANFMNPELRAA